MNNNEQLLREFLAEGHQWFEDAKTTRLQYSIGDKIVSYFCASDAMQADDVDAHTEKIVQRHETDVDLVAIVALTYDAALTQLQYLN